MIFSKSKCGIRSSGFGKVSYPDQSFLADWMLGCSDAWMPGCLDDSWMLGCLAARMRGCSDAWLTGYLDARMLGYLDDWMLELATRMLGCVADWMLGYPDAGVGCPDAWLTGCADAWLTGCLAARVPDWLDAFSIDQTASLRGILAPLFGSISRLLVQPGAGPDVWRLGCWMLG